MFSSELENIYIYGAEDVTNFAISTSEGQIFTSDLQPFSDGTICLYGMRKLFESYISDVYADFEISIGALPKINVRIFLAQVMLSENAVTFLPSFFMTTLMTSKVTKLNHYETLSFYAHEVCRCYALISYYHDCYITTEEVELITANDISIDEINTIDVSPKLFADTLKGELLSYTIVAGERKFDFILNETLPDAEPSLIFKNSFGCWETFYLTGTQENIAEIKRSIALIDGAYNLYDMEEVENHKVNSGIMLGNMMHLGLELARSRFIFFLDIFGSPTHRIVITDTELKYTNDDNALPTFDYTYRRASTQTVLVDTIRPPKLFDKTFDKTFN